MRLGTRIADGTGASQLGAAVPGDPSIAAQGQVPAAGGTFYYQGWYRDTAPFCMPEGFNLSNGIAIPWAP